MVREKSISLTSKALTEILFVVLKTDMENRFLKMGILSKVSISMANLVGKASTLGLIYLGIKDNSRMEPEMVMELGLAITLIPTVIDTKVNIKMIRRVVLDCTVGRMEQAMRDSFSMI
jgi:hypothetical protein